VVGKTDILVVLINSGPCRRSAGDWDYRVIRGPSLGPVAFSKARLNPNEFRRQNWARTLEVPAGHRAGIGEPIRTPSHDIPPFMFIAFHQSNQTYT
jgi:hypothetical protein